MACWVLFWASSPTKALHRRAHSLGPMHSRQPVPFIVQHPWFGLGFGAFPPQIYFFTDDQYLNSTIVTGIVGLLALFTLFVTWLDR